jgi:hypothetical protein
MSLNAGQFFVRNRVFAAVIAISAAAIVPSAHAAANPAEAPASVNFNAGISAPLNNLTYADMAYGVSSSSAPDAVEEERDSLASTSAADQPPPRRRSYGRPRYADNMHNADGSTKYAFEFGGGFAAPAGSTSHYNTLSYKFSVGGGLNFNKTFGVLLQYDYDHFGLTGGNLNRQYNLYNTLGYDAGTFDGLDANAHVWSITANPTFSFQGAGRTGAYLVVGGGYYRKTTNFTLPSTGCYYDYFGNCYQYTANQTFDSYTNGAMGVNGGVGLTYKVSNFSSNRLFAEARYVWVDNNGDKNAFYPANGYRTGYFPVTVGMRW